jgi:hypothetical protein
MAGRCCAVVDGKNAQEFLHGLLLLLLLVVVFYCKP